MNLGNYGIWIPGKPQPKERPRFANGRAYTPQATRDYEKRIAQAWREAYPGVILEGNLTIHVDAQSRTADRADVDNYLKIALDGLQGIAFLNDNKVQTVKGSKLKVDTPELEGMRIAIFTFVLKSETASTAL
jgi:Holliday junction resolvase RusA-like endonuclease